MPSRSIYEAFASQNAPVQVLDQRIGGSIMIVEKRPYGGPIMLLTAGLARLPIGQGLPVELAVEVLDGQQGAGIVALTIVCDDVANNRRTPPIGSPWVNSEPFLAGTQITSIVAGGSRWGSTLDDVRDERGVVVGHLRTLRMLTTPEAAIVAERGWDALVAAAGSPDALLDVMRPGVNAGAAPVSQGAPTPANPAPRAAQPILVSKLHAEQPPRWVTLEGGLFRSVTGLESPEYMANSNNHEIVSLDAFLARYPWTRGFVEIAQEGQTALFTDSSGAYTRDD